MAGNISLTIWKLEAINNKLGFVPRIPPECKATNSAGTFIMKIATFAKPNHNCNLIN